MGTFTTNLKLGQEAFGVHGGLDPTIETLTVGQLRVIQTLPRCRSSDSDPCYKEEYMCIETGVGTGTVWEYGKNIFASRVDAEAGVIAQRQAAHKAREEREAERARYAERRRQADLQLLAALKAQYEPATAADGDNA